MPEVKAAASAQLTELMQQWVSQGQLPGVHYIVLEKGKVMDELLLGYADIDTERRLHEHSLFRLASAAKIYLSAATLTLLDTGDFC